MADKDSQKKENKLLLFVKAKLIKIVIAVILLIIAIAGLNFLKSKNVKSEFETGKVKKREIKEVISASGKVESDEEVSLKFQTSGRLAWVGVKKGDYVQKWQAIASLDKQELERTLKKELIDYMNERWDFEQIMLDDYQDMALTETIRRVKEQSQFDLDRTVLDVELADIALKYATLVTPIEGIITQIDTPYPGINITPATAEFVVSNPNKMVFKAKVDEVDIAKVFAGQMAELILDAYPENTLTVLVDSIEFTSISTSGGGTAYNVGFILPVNQDNIMFRIGMNGDVDIIIVEAKDALSVPIDAIKYEDENTFVYVMDNNQPIKTAVTTGISDDFYVQVNNLQENQDVITDGFENIKE